MNTPIPWNASISGQVAALHGKWKELQRGLRLVLLGHLFLWLAALPGLGLAWLGKHPPASLQMPEGMGPEDLAVIGWGLAGVGTLLGYLLVLVGQWHCLGYASQRHAAKELLFCCLLTILLAPACLGASLAFGTTLPSRLAVEGLQAIQFQTFTQPGELLLLGGLLLGVGNLLLFTGFLRATVKCADPSRGAALSRYFWFVAFLIGATIGLCGAPSREVLLGLGAGWAIALLWHASLIGLAARTIDRVTESRPDQQRRDDSHKARPYSGLHRYYVRIRTE